MFRFATNEAVSVDHFRDLLLRSTLADRRPVDDPLCLQGMIERADLLATAWDGTLLVGIARSVTDFHLCCYLSDLAVDVAYQRKGIGRQLVQITRDALGPLCTIILLSAPAAVDYYPRIGFKRHDQAWVLSPLKASDSNQGNPGARTSAQSKDSTPEEQMALFEEDLKANDWGHQPC